jgi:hypothetical protein
MNLCRACRRDFTGVRDFDSHRVGAHAYVWSLDAPAGRRCLDSDDLADKGWTQDRHGRWSHPRRSALGSRHSRLRNAA